MNWKITNEEKENAHVKAKQILMRYNFVEENQVAQNTSNLSMQKDQS